MFVGAFNMPEFKFKVGDNDLIVKGGEKITIGLVIRDRNTVTIAKKDGAYIIAFELHRFKAFKLGLTLLNFYSKSLSKKQEKRRKESVSIDELDELLSESKAKKRGKKKSEEEVEEESEEEEESLIESME